MGRKGQWVSKTTKKTRVVLRDRIYEKYPSLAEFAKEVGRSNVWLSQVVQGHREPDLQMKLRMAGILGCDSREVFP